MRIKSYLNNKITIQSSSLIHNCGMFADKDIETGEVLFVKGGHILTKHELYSSSIINSYFPISDNLFLGALEPEEEDDIKLYINHSCNPNCGLHGEITFVAIRDIHSGEEITTDYAFIDNEDYSFECNCGSDKCRKTITGFDWKIKRLQEEYYPYFAQYLKDKITRI